MNRNEFLEDLLNCTADLPEQKRIEALGDCFSAALKLMECDTIRELRAQLLNRRIYDPAHESIINLIDGHLILREFRASL